MTKSKCSFTDALKPNTQVFTQVDITGKLNVLHAVVELISQLPIRVHWI